MEWGLGWGEVVWDRVESGRRPELCGVVWCGVVWCGVEWEGAGGDGGGSTCICGVGRGGASWDVVAADPIEHLFDIHRLCLIYA